MRKRTAFATVGVVVIAIAAIVNWRIRLPEARVYRIGWEHDPPNQVAVPGKDPTGFAIDLVREAARRRGIRLQWVHATGDPLTIMTSGQVDLWPLFTITEERRKLLYFSRPYQAYDYVLVVPARSGYEQAGDVRRGTVTSNGIIINDTLVRQYLPGLVHVGSLSSADGLERACRGEFAGYFGERFATLTALLESRYCPGTPLRMLPISTFRTQLGVASTFAAGVAADEIRDEIGEMASDGEAAKICSRWGAYSAQALIMITEFQYAQRRVLWYRLGIAGVGAVCVAACLLAVAYRRARNGAEKAGRALREAERDLRLLTSSLTDMVLAYDMNGRLTYVNPGAAKLTGYSIPELLNTEFAAGVHPDDLHIALDTWKAAREGRTLEHVVGRLITKSGQERWFSSNWGPLRDEFGKQIGVQASGRDITDLKRAEQESAMLQDRLLQAQKLESVGRLAGGVAHDFNNLLTIITGFGHLLLQDLEQRPEHAYVKEIIRAADRAADLTAQLLAFSRKQMIQPTILDVNRLIEDTARMIHRLIGEDIELTTVLDPSVWHISADRGQITQVLMNLAANARDAIPGAGTLRIETRNQTLDSQYTAAHSGVEPGDYVMIAVTDSGAGMDQHTLSHIFEPFFTTKEVGRGVGLGLATIYGIMKQAGGDITVTSAPDEGTTFRLYFPRAKGDEPVDQSAPATSERTTGWETILVAEDQDEVRAVVVQVLRSLGYQVFEASGGDEAIKLARQHPGDIHLLITDVVMRGMDGHELARKLTYLRPDMGVLYMSGYSENVVAHQGALDPDISFISKPFSPDDLAEKVRVVLNQSKG